MTPSITETIVASPLSSAWHESTDRREIHSRCPEKWNAAWTDYPRDICVHELFEEQVKLGPDRLAVVFEDQQLTYGELNERAERLAEQLHDLGVTPGALVGIYLDRSPDQLVAILGTFKAGGTYLPLDPLYPPARLAMIVEESRPKVILTQSHLEEMLHFQSSPIICIDASSTALIRDQARLRPSATTLAYILYTSGSTGRPKGVQVSHRAVVNLLLAMRTEIALTADDKFLSVTTIAFDIAVLEFFLPMIAGACVVLATHEVAHDGAKLGELLARKEVNVIQATPARWMMLLQSGFQGARNLKVLCGGEVLTRELADQLQEHCGALWNLYGPTETTIYSTAHKVRPGEPITIGRPIANTQVYVLDEHQQPLEAGIIGELYIGGDGVSPGYLNRPELNALRFVPDPFNNAPGARLFRTGDLARLKPDGSLDFLGRIDHQVKIRGFRIELGEIEAALLKHTDVAQSIVLAREDRPGDIRLVAYLVPRPGKTISILNLRTSLRERLPDYMVPSAFVSTASFPLTPNGKLDRKALPEPARDRSALSTSYHSPQNEIEQRLQSIWCDVLGVQEVGIDDNFFELGGHSLLAVQLFDRIEKVFQKRLPLALLFQHATVAGIARCLADSADDHRRVSIVELQAGAPGRLRLFALPTIGAELLVLHRLIQHLGPATPLYGLQPNLTNPVSDDVVDFVRTARHYVEALRLHQPSGPYALVGYSYGGMLAYEVARQLTRRNC